jgi:phosphomannomutase
VPTHAPDPTALDRAVEAARRWRDLDPDPATAAELDRLISSRAPELVELFAGRLEFGTAGLRAELGPGPMRMNRLLVHQTTRGVMRHLPDGATVVVGHDARHRSAEFALDAADAIAAAGGRALVFPRPVPTPVVAHAVLDLGADAALVITASHNPPVDNGYKLYLHDGIQLVPPMDARIAASIGEVAAAELADGATSGSAGGGSSDRGRVQWLEGDVLAPHRRASVAALLTGERDVRVLYTPMHGVGGEAVLAAFAAAGFPAPDVVQEQFDPDPDFPTVAFPNPEEPGALDLALDRAAATGPDLVLANDPDADRLAAAVPGRDGGWVRLTGDELGALLGDHLLRHTTGDDRLVATSLVSSRLLPVMAAAAGVEAVVTLTGFKWVARPIVDRPDRRYLFGYEEAIGYCVGDRVRDKDGVTAALVAAEMVAGLRRQGRTVWDRLDALAAEHGVHRTGPVSVRLPGATGMARRAEIVDRLVAAPPRHLGGVAVTEVEDLSAGASLPPTEGVVLHLADRTRVIVRPSGTEPKLKGYVEVIEPVDDGAVDRAAVDRAAMDRAAVDQARTRADERLTRCSQALLAELQAQLAELER